MAFPGMPVMLHVAGGRPCPACRGLGAHPVQDAPACRGCGGACVVHKKRAYDVRIAPGVGDGHVEILRGKGGVDLQNGSECGDVAIRVRHAFENDVKLDASTGNVHVTVRLGIDEVLCGFTKDIALSHFETSITAHAYRDPAEPMVFPDKGIRPGSSTIITFDVAFPKAGSVASASLVKYKGVLKRVFCGSTPPTEFNCL